MCMMSLLFYNHCNREGDVTSIPFAMRTCQGDFLGGALFVLTHFRALRSTTNLSLFVYFHPLQMTLTLEVSIRLYHLHMNVSRLNSM
jgi:hypothetical protein